MPKKTSSVNDIIYYERSSGTMQREEVLGDRMLRLAYLSPLRSILRVPLFHASLFSRLAGVYADTKLSCRRIEPTIRQLNINMDDFVVPEGGYKSFNEFFSRKLRMGARQFDPAPDALCSPADCRIKVWPVLPDGICFPIKGRTFSMAELLGDENRKLAERFIGGSLCICRLCPADYHRYHFPAAGRIVSHWKLKGNYHSVNPMALAQNIAVFNQNAREVTILKLKNEDVDCAFVEVGAFMKRPGSEACEGVTSGYGAINGKLAYAFSQDADLMLGVMDELHAQKIQMIY